MRLLRLLVAAAILATVIAVRHDAPRPVHAAGPAWTTYHYTNSREANDPTEGTFTQVSRTWAQAGLDGQVYAEPLVLGTSVYVATENDSIYAFDTGTGSPQWSLNLGTPAAKPGNVCGNIDPIGITSTPVIDPAANVIYVVGLIASGAHHLWGVDLSSHSTVLDVVIDAPASNPTLENQRGALALANGRIYVPFGGRAGDCGDYHGFVTSVTTAGAGLRSFQTTTQNRAGGSWAPSGPAVDGAGNLYISTGNGYSDAGTFDRQESVIKLNPNLDDPPLGIWAPPDWHSLDNADADIGSTGPLLLGSTGMVFQVGKNETAYLLSQSALGSGPASPLASLDLSGSGHCFGGGAFDGSRVYFGCGNAFYALNVTSGPPSLSVAWSRPGGSNAPILAAGAVWWPAGGRLHAANPVNGSAVFDGPVENVAHFGTPSAGGGRIFVPLSTGVAAYTLMAPSGPYTPISPFRLLDTRTSAALGPNHAINVQVAGLAGLPASGVAAATINITVTNPTAGSYLTLFPSGQPVPMASSVNFAAGQTVANLDQVAVGGNGMVSVYNSEGTADVILDLQGWYASAPQASRAGLFHPMAPVRVLDTRGGTGGYSTPFAPNQTRELDVRAALADQRASAVVLNLTAVNGSAASYLTAYPAGTGTRPVASNVNFPAGRNLPNRVVVKLGTGTSAGRINLYNSEGLVDVVADLGGWFTDGTDPAATGGIYHPLPPTRILDTRDGAPLGPNASLQLQVAFGSPAMAVALNVAVTNPGAASFVTIYPAGQSLPNTSDLNFASLATVANFDIVMVGAGGNVVIYNNLGSIDVLADFAGYYA